MLLLLILSQINAYFTKAQNVQFYGSYKAYEKFQLQNTYENVHSKIECGLYFTKNPDAHAFQYKNETKTCVIGSLGMFPGDLYFAENDTVDNSTFIIKDCLLQSKFITLRKTVRWRVNFFIIYVLKPTLILNKQNISSKNV